MQKGSPKGVTLPSARIDSPQTRSFGGAPAVSSYSTEMSKELSKQPAPEIAAHFFDSNSPFLADETNLTGRKKFEDYSAFKQPMYGNSVNQSPSMSGSRISLAEDSKKPKGAAQMAAKLMSEERAGFQPNITLTSSTGSPASISKPMTPKSPSTPKEVNLKGSAPEVAASFFSQKPKPYGNETTLTEINHSSPTRTTYPSNNLYSQISIESSKKSGKLNGNAPEMAAEIMNNTKNYEFRSDSLSGISGSPTRTTKIVKPYVDIDRDYDKSVSKSPVHMVSNNVPNYAVATEVKKTRNAVSLTDYPSDDENELSEGSTVYTDAEYYLEVGKSAYYFERKRSLKRYRSRRSVKQERAARRQMGLSRGDSVESGLSSISSLKATDPTISPYGSRKRVGAGRKEVNSWLNSQPSGKQFLIMHNIHEFWFR